MDYKIIETVEDAIVQDLFILTELTNFLVFGKSSDFSEKKVDNHGKDFGGPDKFRQTNHHFNVLQTLGDHKIKEKSLKIIHTEDKVNPGYTSIEEYIKKATGGVPLIPEPILAFITYTSGPGYIHKSTKLPVHIPLDLLRESILVVGVSDSKDIKSKTIMYKIHKVLNATDKYSIERGKFIEVELKFIGERPELSKRANVLVLKKLDLKTKTAELAIEKSVLYFD
jgi:hypothetical protein